MFPGGFWPAGSFPLGYWPKPTGAVDPGPDAVVLVEAAATGSGLRTVVGVATHVQAGTGSRTALQALAVVGHTGRTMAARTILDGLFAERTTTQLTARLVQEDGATGFQPSTLTLTLSTKKDGRIINSVNGTNILNTGRGTITSDGDLTLTLTPADMQIVYPQEGHTSEWHVALVSWTWAGGAKGGHHEIHFEVANFAKVN